MRGSGLRSPTTADSTITSKPSALPLVEGAFASALGQLFVSAAVRESGLANAGRSRGPSRAEAPKPDADHAHEPRAVERESRGGGFGAERFVEVGHA